MKIIKKKLEESEDSLGRWVGGNKKSGEECDQITFDYYVTK